MCRVQMESTTDPFILGDVIICMQEIKGLTKDKKYSIEQVGFGVVFIKDDNDLISMFSNTRFKKAKYEAKRLRKRDS